MKVINDIVAVRRRKANTRFEIVGHKEHIGEVIAVGPGIYTKLNGKDHFKPTSLNVGDSIMFSHRAGMETEVEGESVLFMREADVLCVLDPESVEMTDNAADETDRECVGKVKFGGV